VGLCGDLPDSIQDITSDYNTAIGSTCPDLCYQGLMEDSPRSCPDLSLSSCVCPADTRWAPDSGLTASETLASGAY